MTTNFDDVRDGDIVRIVLEGKVSEKWQTELTIGKPNFANRVYSSGEHVKSIEVLNKKYRVGDKLPGTLVETLPTGTMLTLVSANGGEEFLGKLYYVDGEHLATGVETGRHRSWSKNTDTFLINFLPETA